MAEDILQVIALSTLTQMLSPRCLHIVQRDTDLKPFAIVEVKNEDMDCVSQWSKSALLGCLDPTSDALESRR